MRRTKAKDELLLTPMLAKKKVSKHSRVQKPKCLYKNRSDYKNPEQKKGK
jgi:hypothetical protein